MKNEEMKVVNIEKKTNVNENLTSVEENTNHSINSIEIKDVTPENKKNGKTKKIIAIVSSVVVLICLAIGIWAIVEKNANNWELKQSEVTVEYGEVYEPTITDFIDNDKYPNVTENNTVIKVETDSEKLEVGSYNITVVHKIEYKLFGMVMFTTDDTKTAKLNVLDTIAPVFAEDAPTELETYKDCEIENINDIFKATDLSEISITVDNIDVSTVGEQTINVFATDKSGNVTKKEIKVTVIEPTISVSDTAVNIKVGSSKTITATVKGKSQDVKWTSSDESIAKVDNGVITAVATGKATIEAEANGVKASVNVVVTKVEVKTTTNNKTATSNNKGNSIPKPTTNNNKGTEEKPNNSKPSNPKKETSTKSGCADGHHSDPCGNIGKWFNSKSELHSYVFDDIIGSWNKKVDNGEITREEYRKKCPQGYECWRCSNCGKWTGNFKRG